MQSTVNLNYVYISGTLRDYNGDLISKKKINIYQNNETHLTLFKTNPDGSFRVQIQNISDYSQVKLLFRLCQESKIICEQETKNSDMKNKYTLLKIRHEKEELGLIASLNSNETFLGEIQMDTAFEDEKVPLSYTLAISKSAIPSILRGVLISAKTALVGSSPEESIEDIQYSYGIGSIPLTDMNIWKLLLNGICPIYFKKEKDGTLSAEFNWDAYLFDKTSLPNTKAYFSNWQGDNPSPNIEKIEVQYRKGLNPSKGEQDMHPKTIHYSTDGDFVTIKRKFNNGAIIFGQTVYHLGWGHVYGARIAQLSYDYLQGTKLGELILPHCKFIRKITNDLGKTAIMGAGGILDRSPLSPDGIYQLIGRSLGALNPFTSRPRHAINKTHTFALDLELFYKAIKTPIKDFIDVNWDEISTKDWAKVSAFFSKVHSGSPLFNEWGSERIEISEWLDSREIGGRPNPRVPARTKSSPFDSEVRSIPLIAKNINGPEEHDQEMIRLFVRDFINRVTIWHSSIHRTQYAESENFPHSKDVGFTPICLEGNGEGEYGGMLKEDVLQQQQVGRIFQNFPVSDYAITNEDSGVNPEIVSAVNKISKKLFIPVDQVTFSTVI